MELNIVRVGENPVNIAHALSSGWTKVKVNTDHLGHRHQILVNWALENCGPFCHELTAETEYPEYFLGPRRLWTSVFVFRDPGDVILFNLKWK
jgi:hypothetical protein